MNSDVLVGLRHAGELSRQQIKPSVIIQWSNKNLLQGFTCLMNLLFLQTCLNGVQKVALAAASLVVAMAAPGTVNAAEVYVHQRPPFSFAGTIYKGKLWRFSNDFDTKCYLYLEGGCYRETEISPFIVRWDIFSAEGIYYCLQSTIPDTMNKSGYAMGYGECTANGWVLRGDP